MKTTNKAIALILAIFLCVAPTGCKSTYQTDKKRLIIFTFGFGLTFMSDKEAALEIESKSPPPKAKEGGEN